MVWSFRAVWHRIGPKAFWGEGMEPFFSLAVLTEPDRQRFARFVNEAAEALGASAFAVAPRTVELLEHLRRYCSEAQGGVTAALAVDGRTLYALCGEQYLAFTELPEPPAAESVTALAGRLRARSESADPELLRRRNERISAELEQAQERAAAEMAELEQALERKKTELADSIRLAETDSLTGLLNRGAYDHRLRDAVVRCTRQHQPLSLILLDLDHFKEINDRHGHQYGDDYLKRMAGELQAAIRENVDHPCRVGGDEFAIIVNAELRVAERVAEQVLKGMDGRVSAGVAELRHDDDAQSLVARADAALYEAKEGGRGRVALARSAVAEPQGAAAEGMLH